MTDTSTEKVRDKLDEHMRECSQATAKTERALGELVAKVESLNAYIDSLHKDIRLLRMAIYGIIPLMFGLVALEDTVRKAIGL